MELLPLIVTKQFLDAHKTKSGGYNRRQLEAIGVKWPPGKGWKSAVIGLNVTPKQVELFIKCKIKVIYSKKLSNPRF